MSVLSLIIPVYRNEGSIPELLNELESLARRLDSQLEVVFVVDGSPDRSLNLLADALPRSSFRSQLLVLSRNFGSFQAIRAGLVAGTGDLFAVMAADLQEPPELALCFVEELRSGGCDVVVGTRQSRKDPLFSRLFSMVFWRFYRLLVQREVPRAGVDVFGCTREFRDHLLCMRETNSTLVGLIFWLGFRRREVPYARRPRMHGRGGWSFWRKIRYLLDSAFAFSDLPVRLLSICGMVGLVAAVVQTILVLWAKFLGRIEVPGYAATVIAVTFFGGLNSLGLGLLGEYLWRTFENTKQRPGYVVAVKRVFSNKKTIDDAKPYGS